MTDTIPGWEGTVGPSPGQYGKPHVYALDVHSGAGNCVCGRHRGHGLHVQPEPMTDAVRPGDQPPPRPSEGPGMHDDLIAALRGIDDPTIPALCAELAARRDLGLQRYGTVLQAGNGRDALRDLLDELLDAMAYARQALHEGAFDCLPDEGSAIEHVLAGTASAVIGLMQRWGQEARR